MGARYGRWLSASLGLVIAAGCAYPGRENIDSVVCDMAARPVDPQPVTPADARNAVTV